VDPEWSCYTCRRVVKFGEEEKKKWARPINVIWGTAKAMKKPGAKVRYEHSTFFVYMLGCSFRHYFSSRSHASQKAELVRAISKSVVTAPAASATPAAADLVIQVFRGTAPITRTPIMADTDDPMNCTLEDLIVKGLDRELTPRAAPPTSVATVATAVASPETETSPGDSDYESENNGIQFKARKKSTAGSTAATPKKAGAVDFDQLIKKSIKEKFLVP
jgi:hypothetical protein